jgi:ParB-like chromosome segregation protein Spo0J
VACPTPRAPLTISSLPRPGRTVNARIHSHAQIDLIAASIVKWGWSMPILASEDGTTLSGHGRVLAAGKLGLAEVPVVVARGWTEEQKRAYVLADNQIGLRAGWDEGLLRLELGALQAAGFDLASPGRRRPPRAADRQCATGKLRARTSADCMARTPV